MSVNTSTPFQRTRQGENFSFSHWTHIFPEKICSLIEPCLFWVLDKAVVQQEGTREACHHVLKDHVWQIKVHHLPLNPELSDRLVFGFISLSSSGLSASSLVICLATPIMRSYDFAKHKAARLKFSALCFCPRVMLFGELGISISDGFSKVKTDFWFSIVKTKKAILFSRVKPLLFKKKSLSCL